MASTVDIISIAVAVIGTVFTIFWSLRQSKNKKEQFKKEFINIRKEIKIKRIALQDTAVRELIHNKNRSLIISDEFPLLIKEGWNPKVPVDLNKVETIFGDDIKPSLLKKPIRFGEYETYCDAIVDLDKPRIFYDLTHYRLLGIDKEKLIFSNKTYSYFDKINSGGALLFRYALSKKNKKWKSDYDSIAVKLSEPSDIVILSGVNTLLLLVCNDGLRFLMSQRGTDIGSSEGTYHVIPAGEFQPSCRAAISFIDDLNIWKTIMRESAEEILCMEEYNGNLGTPFDYNQEPYLSLENARNKNRLKVLYMGTGLDPLTFQAEILTCMLIEEETFVSIFGKIPKRENNENVLINDQDRWGRPFNDREITPYLNQNTLAATKALLNKARENIEMLKSAFEDTL